LAHVDYGMSGCTQLNRRAIWKAAIGHHPDARLNTSCRLGGRQRRKDSYPDHGLAGGAQTGARYAQYFCLRFASWPYGQDLRRVSQHLQRLGDDAGADDL
jgi:hypothetical protein